jgi:RecA/RadA recombinase
MTDKAIDKLIEVLNAKYTPEGAVLPVVARSSDRPIQKYIPCTSPALGFVMGTGGWPIGHLSEFFGKEHAGKTTLLMLALKDAYEYYDGKRPVAYIDVEHRYNEDWARRLGLPDELIVVQPTDAEQATDIMQTLIRPSKGLDVHGVCAIGFDSIGAAAASQESQTFGEKEYVIGRTAGIMTRNVRTIAPLANLYNASVFYTNQLRADFQGYNRPLTPGGHAVKHMMSIRLYLWPSTGNDTKKMDKIDGQKVQVGFEMNFRAVKNTFGPPGRDGRSSFYFRPSRLFEGIGFDIEEDIQILGILTEVIKKQGTSYYVYGDIKANGRDPFFKQLKEHGMYDQLFKDIQSHLDAKFSTMFEGDEDRGEAFIPIDDPEI